MRTIILEDIHGACSEGLEWFEQNFPGGGEYQAVLNKLAEENLVGWAQWLMQRFGHTDELLQVEGDLISEASICFAGQISIRGTIKVKKYLEAGEGIEAGGGIKAGADFGIYVGLRIRISEKKEFAIVRCKEKPKNLLCGEWRQAEK